MEYDSRPSGSSVNPLIFIVGGVVALVAIAAVAYFVLFMPGGGDNSVAQSTTVTTQSASTPGENTAETTEIVLDPNDWRRGFRTFQQNYSGDLVYNPLTEVDGDAPETFFRLFDGQVSSAPGLDGYEGIISLYVTPKGRRVLRLHGDYSMPPTPGLTLTLSSKTAINTIGDLTAPHTATVEVAAIESFGGETHFIVPDDMPVDALQTVALWSKPYNVLVASAVLAPY